MATCQTCGVELLRGQTRFCSIPCSEKQRGEPDAIDILAACSRIRRGWDERTERQRRLGEFGEEPGWTAPVYSVLAKGKRTIRLKRVVA